MSLIGNLLKYALACGTIFALPSPQGLSYQELQLLRGNCQDLLCSLIKLSGWLVGGGWFFFSFTCPIPLSEICWNPFYIRFFFCDTFRVFEILSRSLAMGHRKEIFELDLCGSIFFFFKSLPTSQKLCWWLPVHNCCLTYSELDMTSVILQASS